MQLARAVRNRTAGVLYVLDEPSIGLHPANLEGLVGVMRDLVADGNSVVLVDHDPQVLRAADWILELGPGAGARGGTLVAQGTVAQIAKNPASVIGPFLRAKTCKPANPRTSQPANLPTCKPANLRPRDPATPRTKKKGRPDREDPGGPWKKNPGGALLSRGRLPQYPRHWGPSLPCSEWERVLPPRHGHQGKDAEDENRGKYAAARHER